MLFCLLSLLFKCFSHRLNNTLHCMEVSFSFTIFLSVSHSLSFLSLSSLSLSSSHPQINDNLYLSLLVGKVLGLCVLVIGVS